VNRAKIELPDTSDKGYSRPARTVRPSPIGWPSNFGIVGVACVPSEDLRGPGMALEPGDHAWYWNGLVSTDRNIPQASWFPGFHGPTDYLGHGKEIFHFVLYDSEIARGQPHMRTFPGSFSWLNNNPGNLTGVDGGPDYGQYPGKFNWHRFLVFPTWEAGFAAIALFLRGPNYVGLSICRHSGNMHPHPTGTIQCGTRDRSPRVSGFPPKRSSATLTTIK